MWARRVWCCATARTSSTIGISPPFRLPFSPNEFLLAFRASSSPSGTQQARLFSCSLGVFFSLFLFIFFVAGQERYAALGPIYYRDANGALLVYDITDRQSFDRVKQVCLFLGWFVFSKLEKWVKELKKMKEGDCVLVIIGNKIDLERQRTVTQKEAGLCLPSCFLAL